ncbi:CDKN2AIP N-terminal-like protein isoform X2 [Chlorocebus sabaeus]|uniref:CDKN2AIP N-terminal-like protein isoform X2 n=1 Tax=Chlorocebus sabaeus TaxID=60711 RepID=UPI0018B0B7D0|nr:CDKN2AIP N-terminal-like protein isoform X2 [Chlorocebus sabaeus]
MVGGEAAAAVEELVSGVRQAADFAEQFRSYSESEKQWKARMEFILRHLPDYRDPPDGGGRLDQLLSLSMVWANHLFLGCSYNKDLLDKVMEMADGIEVDDLPQFTTRTSKLSQKIYHIFIISYRIKKGGWDECDIDHSSSLKTSGITNIKRQVE